MRIAVGILTALLCLPTLAAAQNAPATAPAAGMIQLPPEQLQMLHAAKAAARRDFSGAAAIYSQIIASNPNHIEAHIQRGIVRREMKDEVGARADGETVVQLTEALLPQNPDNGLLYHERGMGYRLLKDFSRARADIERAIQLAGNNTGWQNDLQAITLEEKMYQ